MPSETNYTLLYIVIMLAIAGVFAALCSSLANKKGYHAASYTWLGFFLGIIGMLYVMSLPVKAVEQTATQEPKNSPISAPAPTPAAEPEPRPPREKWQRGEYPAGLVALRLCYMGGYSMEFKKRVKKLLESGFTDIELFNCCVDDDMKRWLISAIEEQ